jgi:hypothetical protein
MNHKQLESPRTVGFPASDQAVGRGPARAGGVPPATCQTGFTHCHCHSGMRMPCDMLVPS